MSSAITEIWERWIQIRLDAEKDHDSDMTDGENISQEEF